MVFLNVLLYFIAPAYFGFVTVELARINIITSLTTSSKTNRVCSKIAGYSYIALLPAVALICSWVVASGRSGGDISDEWLAVSYGAGATLASLNMLRKYKQDIIKANDEIIEQKIDTLQKVVEARTQYISLAYEANQHIQNAGSPVRFRLQYEKSNEPINLEGEYKNYISGLPKDKQIQAIKKSTYATQEERDALLRKIQGEGSQDNEAQEERLDEKLDLDTLSSPGEEIIYNSPLGENRNYDDDMTRFHFPKD